LAFVYILTLLRENREEENKGVGRGKESEMGVRGEESAWSTESVVWESDWSALTGICVLK